MFERGRELAIEGYTYPEELIPDPLHGIAQAMQRRGGTAGEHDARDYDDLIARMDDHAVWTAQAIANLRDGLRRGYALPREVVEHALPVLEEAGRDTPQNAYYQPLRTLPPGLAEPARAQLAARFTAAVRGRLLPACRQLHDFLAAEYLPRARAGVALAEFPLGDAWYEHRVKAQTDGGRTPAQIHELGLGEVERVRGRIREVLTANGVADDMQMVARLLRQEESATAADGAAAQYQDLRARVAAAMPALFVNPPADVDMSLPASALAGGAWTQASYLHDVVPGRLYQQANAAPSLPRFRRFGDAPAFIQGWALYCESLGEELGLYGDLKAKLASLVRDLQSSAALVVDTGMQSRHWTRRRAFDYLRAHTPMDQEDADAALDRMIAAPAEALAAKIGELEFLALRGRALQTGGRELRDFHTVVLQGGPMPLDMLEARIDRWIAAPR
jgi:uncharacterized protein (DUF885 family)